MEPQEDWIIQCLIDVRFFTPLVVVSAQKDSPPLGRKISKYPTSISVYCGVQGSPCLSQNRSSVGTVFLNFNSLLGLTERVASRLGGLPVLWRPRPPGTRQDIWLKDNQKIQLQILPNTYTMYYMILLLNSAVTRATTNWSVSRLHIFQKNNWCMKKSKYTNSAYRHSWCS